MSEQMMPLELEVKLHLLPGAVAALEAHPTFRACSVPAQDLQQVTTYFDTTDWDLARNGASLRIRRTNEQRVQTLKLRGDGEDPFSRNEWEWEVEGDAPDLNRLAETPAGSLLGETPSLRPAFTAEMQRTVRLLRFGGATIEASLNQGFVSVGETLEEVRELELELKEGEVAALYRLAVELHATLPLTLGVESKAERGWRLSTGRPRQPTKQKKLLLREEIGAAEAFRRIIGVTLANLLANQPAATSGRMEGVHNMRIAIRRLRAALVLFRPHLEPYAYARLAAALRHLGRVLGEARDWDVFCEETLRQAADDEGVGASWIELLRGPAEMERKAAHQRLAKELSAPGFTATVLGLAAWAEEPDLLTGTLEDGAMLGPLVELMPKLEARLERKALRLGRGIRHRSAEELHDLRKALKRLRYGVEFLAPLHRRKRLKNYLQHCAALQERLGTINDAAVAVALAERLGGDRQPEFAPAVAALASWAEAQRVRALQNLPDAWRGFKDAPLPN
jgi:inorganic triphosphatase YgiF